MKLTNREIVAAVTAIQRLGEFKLKPGNASWNLSENLAALERLKEPIDIEHQRIIRETFGNDKPLVTHPEYFNYDMRHDEMMRRERDMEKVLKVKKADLDLEKNSIPPETLKSLRFMIDAPEDVSAQTT